MQPAPQFQQYIPGTASPVIPGIPPELLVFSAKMGSPAACTVRVTPELAGDWMERNHENRPLVNAVAQNYAAEVRSGQWKNNGESIKFSTSGRLLDGQHRLTGIIMAKHTIETLVTIGLADDVFVTLDTGKKRTTGDVLGIQGHERGRELAAAAQVVLRWEKGMLATVARLKPTPSTQDMMAVIERHPGLVASNKQIAWTSSGAGMSRSAQVAFHYIFSRIDSAAADRFITNWRAGAALAADDPVYHLRERLRAKPNTSGTKTRAEAEELVIRAWNHRRAGNSLTRLQSGRRDRENRALTID